MNISLFLAKAFALYFMITGVAMLFNRENLKQAMQALAENSGIRLFSAVITLILGIILVLSHNVWVMHWPVVITVLCWITLVKGTVRLLFPKIDILWRGIANKKLLYYFLCIFIIYFGMVLGYFGFH